MKPHTPQNAIFLVILLLGPIAYWILEEPIWNYTLTHDFNFMVDVIATLPTMLLILLGAVIFAFGAIITVLNRFKTVDANLVVPWLMTGSNWIILVKDAFTRGPGNLDGFQDWLWISTGISLAWFIILSIDYQWHFGNMERQSANLPFIPIAKRLWSHPNPGAIALSAFAIIGWLLIAIPLWFPIKWTIFVGTGIIIVLGFVGDIVRNVKWGFNPSFNIWALIAGMVITFLVFHFAIPKALEIVSFLPLAFAGINLGNALGIVIVSRLSD